MSDDEMLEAVVYGIAGWLAVFAFVGGLIWVLSRREPGPEPPRPVPDPAFDPALREDSQVADLDALFELEAGVPGAW